MSESKEMYLITIATLVEAGQPEPLPLSMLGEALQVGVVSVNQMVKKLAQESLVHYEPYKGVALTPAGHQRATLVLRHRRLWEYFLVEHLNLSLTEADALACRLEHLTTEEVGNRLASFLGTPPRSPQGKPIPEGGDNILRPQGQPLNRATVGSRNTVLRLEADQATGAFLTSGGVEPGSEVQVLARGEDGTLLVATARQQMTLTETVAARVQVHPKTLVDDTQGTG